MSLRVSHPLWPLSTFTSSVQACPKSARSYPVLGARPFTARVSSVASALFAAGAADTVTTGVAVGNDTSDVGASEVEVAGKVEVSATRSVIVSVVPHAPNVRARTAAQLPTRTRGRILRGEGVAGDSVEETAGESCGIAIERESLSRKRRPARNGRCNVT